MASEPRCKCCKGLFSLGAECVVITLTVIHVLMSAIELLIHLDVIQVPNSRDESTKIVTTTAATTGSNSSATPSYDPGGCDVSLIPKLEDTVQVVRYATLVISALFFIEVVSKVLYLKKYFLKDLWQVFDFVVVVVSLGIEIAFFVKHDTILCYHPATEAATFVIILRFWRIPRTCNIRRMEFKAQIDDDYRYLRQMKGEKEKECKHFMSMVQNQNVEIEYLKSVLRKNNLLEEENERIPNGTSHGIASAINRMYSKEEIMQTKNETDTDDIRKVERVSQDKKVEKNKLNEKAKLESTHNSKKAIDLERNDSDKNSKANDSGIEVKDSFRSEREIVALYRKTASPDDEVFCDSDGSEIPLPAKVQEVEVQIEEISRQNQLPSVTSYSRSVHADDEDDGVLLRRKASTNSAAYCENAGYDETDDLDEGRTYRSADGIPMTEL